MTTTSDAVLLAGIGPLLPELAELFGNKGWRVYSPETAGEARDDIRLAVEVTNYDLDAKKTVIQTLDQLLKPEIPILTSSLAITATEVASWTRHPERVCGFGTFVPITERNLVEIAPALQTAQAIIKQAESFFQSAGKQTAVVDDEVGLVFPRVLSLIVNEAVFAIMDGTATPEDIDLAMKKGTNYPYGPLEWADRIGLDEIYSVMRGLHRDLGEERYRPASLLRKMVLAGRLGKRSGQGFYSYETGNKEWDEDENSRNR